MCAHTQSRGRYGELWKASERERIMNFSPQTVTPRQVEEVTKGKSVTYLLVWQIYDVTSVNLVLTLRLLYLTLLLNLDRYV